MEYRFTDMHCHILPGVDDGARDIEESRQMLQMAYNEGIRFIIATPHYHIHRGHAKVNVWKEKLEQVRQEASRIAPELLVYLGNEIYWGHDIPEKLSKGRVLTMNHRDTVLLEFSPSDDFQRIHQGLQLTQTGGNDVILAHAERYRCLLEDVELVEEIHEMNVKIQINAGSILGEGGRSAKKFVKELMDRDLVFCVGTDAHDTQKRPPRMKKAALHVKRKYGEEYMRKIFFSNAASLLRKERTL